MKSFVTRMLLASAIVSVIDAKHSSSKDNDSGNGKRKKQKDTRDVRIQEEKYPEFDAVMKLHGYEWTPYEVVTEDEWHLTLFQVTRQHGMHGAERNSAPPILVMPGSFSDATSWLESAQEGVPMPLQLFDHGYDVWLGNNRGTRYSNVNPLFPKDSEDKWDFSWAEMGEYDVPAMIDLILDQTKQKQVTYLGYSMGNTQMFFGLTQLQHDYFADKVNKFIALAPCIYLNERTFIDYQYGIGALRNLGIYVMNGPTWEHDKKIICKYLGPSACMNAMVISGQPQPIRSREWYAQISVESRFQEYAPDYLFGERKQPLVGGGLSSLTEVPMHFIVGQDDSHCSLENAHRIAREIGPAVQSVNTIRGGTHLYFETSTDPRYIDLIIQQIESHSFFL